jgi:hypothetical protein
MGGVLNLNIVQILKTKKPEGGSFELMAVLSQGR